MSITVNRLGRRRGLTKAIGINHELLLQLYWEERLKLDDIAKKYNVSRQLVSYWMKRFNVKTRKTHYKRPTVASLKEFERGWITGLLDGEGYISWNKKGQVRLAIVNTDRDLLAQVLQVVGAGRIELNRKGGEGLSRKDLYVFVLGRAEDIATLLEQLLPHLIVKKVKAQQALGMIWTRLKVNEGIPH